VGPKSGAVDKVAPRGFRRWLPREALEPDERHWGPLVGLIGKPTLGRDLILLGLLAGSQRPRTHQPEIHAHGSKLHARVVECRPGVSPPSRGTMEGSQAEVAAGLERSHLERPGEGERFLVTLTGRVRYGRFPSRGYLGLRTPRPCLVPTLATPAGLLDRLIGPRRRIIQMTPEESGLG